MWDTVQNMFMKDFAYLSWTYLEIQFRKFTCSRYHSFHVHFTFRNVTSDYKPLLKRFEIFAIFAELLPKPVAFLCLIQ